MDKKLTGLIIDLEDTYKDRLVSIILYGSAAFGEFREKVSDLNLIVVLEQMTASDLKLAHSAMKKWLKTEYPLPVFMDKQEMLNSCDIYPIEYSDIKERHKILFGEDFLDSLVINKEYLRLQCEAEIRNLLIKLRQGYLRNSNDKKAINNMIKKGTSSIIAIFRAVLRIMGEEVPLSHKEVIELLAEKISYDKEVFASILKLRENNKDLSLDNSVTVIQKMIDSLKQILMYVDKHKCQEEV